MLLSLCDCAPLSNQRRIKEHVAVESMSSGANYQGRIGVNALIVMACISMDKDSLMYTLALARYWFFLL